MFLIIMLVQLRHSGSANRQKAASENCCQLSCFVCFILSLCATVTKKKAESGSLFGCLSASGKEKKKGDVKQEQALACCA